MKNSTIEFQDRLYMALLSLYPKRFRTRFGREMLQIFQDCRRSPIGAGQQIRLWLGTLSDFAFSIPNQWGREVALEDSEIDYTGLVDLFMVTVVAGANLLGWGWTTAGWALVAAGYQPSTTKLLSVVLTLALAAAIGVFCVIFAVNTSRTECTRLKV